MKTNMKPASILYPQPVLVIASYDKEGHADAKELIALCDERLRGKEEA